MGKNPCSFSCCKRIQCQRPSHQSKALHLAISQSGETADTLSAVKEIQRKGADVYGVVNVVGSSIARQCGKGVYIHSGPEQSVASTKAFTNMVGALALFALQLGRSRHLSKTKGKSIIREMRTLPEKIRAYLEQPGQSNKLLSWLRRRRVFCF